MLAPDKPELETVASVERRDIPGAITAVVVAEDEQVAYLSLFISVHGTAEGAVPVDALVAVALNKIVRADGFKLPADKSSLTSTMDDLLGLAPELADLDIKVTEARLIPM
ncbi:MAG: hypothetical protein AAFO70_03275 [Pseudomonadota bacterium]